MKKTVIALLFIVLTIIVTFILYYNNVGKNTLRFSQLTNEQQHELSKEINTIMGGQCEIISIQKDRIGGQAQVTYYYIYLKCDSINTLLPMKSEREGSGYYFEGDNVVVRVRDNGTKEDKTNLVDCLDMIFH